MICKNSLSVTATALPSSARAFSSRSTLLAEASLQTERARLHIMGAVLHQQGFQALLIAAVKHQAQLLQRLGGLKPCACRDWGPVHQPAAHRFKGGVEAQHESVPRFDSHRLLKAQLRVTILPWMQLFQPAQQHRLAQQFPRAVEVWQAVVPDAAPGIRQHPQRHIQHVAHLQAARGGQHAAPGQILCFHLLQIDRHPLPAKAWFTVWVCTCSFLTRVTRSWG